MTSGDTTWFGLDDPRRVLEVFRSHLGTWANASELQLDRLQGAARARNSVNEGEVVDEWEWARTWTETALLMYAIANTLRFARAIGQSTALGDQDRADVTRLVDNCYRTSPGVRGARDWIEHMDDQLRGGGRPSSPIPTDLGEFVSRRETGEIVGFRIGGIMVEPEGCVASVRDLARDVLRIVDRSGAISSPLP